jgi:excisionase family DNA binding protein
LAANGDVLYILVYAFYAYRRQVLVYTVAELAIALGVAPATAYRAIRLGDLPALRIGKRLVVPRAAVAEMLRKPPRIEDRERR